MEFQLKKYQIALKRNNKAKLSLYNDYKEGIITKVEYFQYKDNYSKEEEMIKAQIHLLKSTINAESKKKNCWIETLLKYRNIASLDRETVGEILDKITVTEMNEELVVNVCFKFKFL